VPLFVIVRVRVGGWVCQLWEPTARISYNLYVSAYLCTICYIPVLSHVQFTLFASAAFKQCGLTLHTHTFIAFDIVSKVKLGCGHISSQLVSENKSETAVCVWAMKS